MTLGTLGYTLAGTVLLAAAILFEMFHDRRASNHNSQVVFIGLTALPFFAAAAANRLYGQPGIGLLLFSVFFIGAAFCWPWSSNEKEKDKGDFWRVKFLLIGIVIAVWGLFETF